MNKLALALAASAALLASACAEYDYGYGYGGPAYYDGWYDNYYGPVYDGYWRSNDFYYRTAPGGVYVIDRGRHFRRNQAPGFNRFHYERHDDHGGPRDDGHDHNRDHRR